MNNEWLSGKCEHSLLTDLPIDSTGNTITYFNRNDKDFQALSKVVRNKRDYEILYKILVSSLTAHV